MPADLGPSFSWNLVADLDQMWRFPFMVNAFRAGLIVAVLSGVVGWFMVLRRQSFAGHTLAVVSFPGAAGAALVGISATYGLFAFAVVAALVIAAVPAGVAQAGSEESALTGTVLALALAAGYLFLSLYGGFLGGVEALLFGTFLGITTAQVVTLLVGAVVVLAALAVIGRPLFFASVDPDVAQARGVPVRLIATTYLVLLALTAAEVSQITGTLLVFALLVAPAAAAQQLTTRPVASLLASAGLGLLITWLALFVGYFTSAPIGFALTTAGFAAYGLATALAPSPRAPGPDASAGRGRDLTRGAPHRGLRPARARRRRADRRRGRAGGLLPGAAGTGVQWRRAQPCRLHGGVGRARSGAESHDRAVRLDHRDGSGCSPCSAVGADPATSPSARASPGSWVWACWPSRSWRLAPVVGVAAPTAWPACASCSGRSSVSTPPVR